MKEEFLLKTVNSLVLKSLEKKSLCFVVKGNSMFPFLKEGNQGTIQKVFPESISFGDSIAFLKQKKLTIHRVVRVKKTGKEINFLTKGDWRKGFDSIVREKKLIGRVERIESKKNFLLKTPFKQTIAIVSLVFGSFCLCAFQMKKRFCF